MRGERNGELSFRRHGVSVWEDEKVAKMIGGGGCTIGICLIPLKLTLKNGKFYVATVKRLHLEIL